MLLLRLARVGIALLVIGLLGIGIISAQEREARFSPPERLAESGTIVYCGTLDNPPRAFITEDGETAGFEVDLGVEIAARMGLEVEWEQMTFDGIIASLQAKRCDAVMQELFIRAERLEIIDMIPFAFSAQSIVVPAGDATGIAGPEDLAGMKVAVPNGTTIFNILTELNEELEEQIDLVILESTTDTFQQLQVGQVDAVGTTNTAAAYYVGLTDTDLEFAGDSFGRILDGIGVNKDDPVLNVAMSAALASIIADGTYAELLDKWNLQGASIGN
jgi:polar amino acid transport system substrate-binding protein